MFDTAVLDPAFVIHHVAFRSKAGLPLTSAAADEQ
jgi:hypothetical protein